VADGGDGFHSVPLKMRYYVHGSTKARSQSVIFGGGSYGANQNKSVS